MAKTANKPPVKRATKTSENGKNSDAALIEKVNVEALKKLKSMGADEQLQADIEWCLGSYSYDKNPIGLYEMARRALKVFQEEKGKNAKAVPAKLITDLEKAIGTAD